MGLPEVFDFGMVETLVAPLRNFLGCRRLVGRSGFHVFVRINTQAKSTLVAALRKFRGRRRRPRNLRWAATKVFDHELTPSTPLTGHGTPLLRGENCGVKKLTLK